MFAADLDHNLAKFFKPSEVSPRTSDTRALTWSAMWSTLSPGEKVRKSLACMVFQPSPLAGEGSTRGPYSWPAE
jgi:hypothetical protein